MTSLFAGLLGEGSTAAAALFSASSAFKRNDADAEKGKKIKRRGGAGGGLAGGDAVGKHAAAAARRKRKTVAGAEEDDEQKQLDLLRSQAEAAAQAAAAAREQDADGDSDGFASSDSGEEDEEERKAGRGSEDELERLAALSESGTDDGGEENPAPQPSPLPPSSLPSHASLTPEQQQERLSRTIFVGNVSPTSKRKALKRVFSEFGKVESVRLRSVPLAKGTSLPRRAALLAKKADASRAGGACAYVVFEERAAAVRALAKNMEEVGGNLVRVDFAAPPSSRVENDNSDTDKPSSSSSPASAPSATTAPASSLYDPALSVFVGNLPPDADEVELVSLFGGRGSVSAVRVVRDRATSLGKGFAFVLLKDAATAAAAKARDGMLLKGRAVRVRKAARDPGALLAAKQRREERVAAGNSGRGGRGGGGRGGSSAGGRGRGRVTPADRLRASVVGGGAGPSGGADWQGIKTKGRGGKVSRGSSGAPKAGSSSGGGILSSKSSSSSGKAAAGKRPSVAARKEASKVLKARGGGVEGKKKRRSRSER